MLYMVKSSPTIKKILKVPKNHEVTIRIPDEIPVNASIEVNVAIHDTRKEEKIAIIDEPIDSFLTDDEADSIDEWTTLASDILESWIIDMEYLLDETRERRYRDRQFPIYGSGWLQATSSAGHFSTTGQ